MSIAKRIIRIVSVNLISLKYAPNMEENTLLGLNVANMEFVAKQQMPLTERILLEA